MGRPLPAGDRPRPGAGRGGARRRPGHRAVGLVVGGSMGGMRALEWAVDRPDRVARCSSWPPARRRRRPDRAGRAQLAAIRADPNWRGGDYYDARPAGPPSAGHRPADRAPAPTAAPSSSRPASAVRRPEDPGAAGSLSSPISTTTPRSWSGGSTPPATSAHGDDEHPRRRPGPRRGRAALGGSPRATLVAGVDVGSAVPAGAAAAARGGHPGGRRLQVIDSPYGHDGFLIEAATVRACSAVCWHPGAAILMARPPERWRPSLVRDYSNRIAVAAVKLPKGYER